MDVVPANIVAADVAADQAEPSDHEVDPFRGQQEVAIARGGVHVKGIEVVLGLRQASIIVSCPACRIL